MRRFLFRIQTILEDLPALWDNAGLPVRLVIFVGSEYPRDQKNFDKLSKIIVDEINSWRGKGDVEVKHRKTK